MHYYLDVSCNYLFGAVGGATRRRLLKRNKGGEGYVPDVNVRNNTRTVERRSTEIRIFENCLCSPYGVYVFVMNIIRNNVSVLL